MESSLLGDFRRLLTEDFEWIGWGEHALRFIRQSGLLNRSNRVLKGQRQHGAHIRQDCQHFFVTTRTTTFTYRVRDVHQQYNGSGQKGTGGPKSAWLKQATDDYIAAHHPELRMTKVMRLFSELGWFIIFTVPYWAKSQPIELVWAYIKGYVGRQYHPGRTSKDLRKHILQGMYGSPDGKHNGLDAELAHKIIMRTHKFINEFAVSQPELNGRGLVGDFTAPGAPIPVITAPINAVAAVGVDAGPVPIITAPINVGPAMGVVVGPTRL